MSLEFNPLLESGLQKTASGNLSLGTITNTTIVIDNSIGTDVTLPQATVTTAGLLSGTDKAKIDGLLASNNLFNYYNFV